MYIPVKINDLIVNLELDCGAACSCISQKTLEKLSPQYRELYKEVNARNLFDVQNNPIVSENDRVIHLEIIGYGPLKHRFAVLKEDNVFLMGRDLMSRTKMSLIYKGNNYYEVCFSKQPSLKIYKTTLHNVYKITNKSTNDSTSETTSSLSTSGLRSYQSSVRTCPSIIESSVHLPENKNKINKVIKQNIFIPTLKQSQQLRNLKKLESTSRIKIMFSKCEALKNFQQFLKMCS